MLWLMMSGMEMDITCCHPQSFALVINAVVPALWCGQAAHSPSWTSVAGTRLIWQ